jgi:hypothetical protein
MSAETRHDEAMVRQALATLARSSHADGLPDRDADDMRRAAYVATQAMDRVVTRLRAAEARTAWQPIETAPPLEEGALGPWVQVWGVRFGRRKPDVHLARLDGIGWGDRDGNSVRPLLWAPAMDAPLPAAPEAP